MADRAQRYHRTVRGARCELNNRCASDQLCLVHDPILHPNVSAEERIKIICRNRKLVVACPDVRLIGHIRTGRDRVEVEDPCRIGAIGYGDLNVVVGDVNDRREPSSANCVVENLRIGHRA